MTDDQDKGWRVVRDLKADWQDWTQVERMMAALIAVAIIVIPFFIISHR